MSATLSVPMALYVIVHHPKAPKEDWPNDWDDTDWKLKAITTTSTLGKRCREAKTKGERVYVYRCALGSAAATVCCSVRVDSVEDLDRASCFVTFADPVPMDSMPPFTANAGQVQCEAPPPQ